MATTNSLEYDNSRNAVVPERYYKLLGYCRSLQEQHKELEERYSTLLVSQQQYRDKESTRSITLRFETYYIQNLESQNELLTKTLSNLTAFLPVLGTKLETLKAELDQFYKRLMEETMDNNERDACVNQLAGMFFQSAEIEGLMKAGATTQRSLLGDDHSW